MIKKKSTNLKSWVGSNKRSRRISSGVGRIGLVEGLVKQVWIEGRVVGQKVEPNQTEPKFEPSWVDPKVETGWTKPMVELGQIGQKLS